MVVIASTQSHPPRAAGEPPPDQLDPEAVSAVHPLEDLPAHQPPDGRGGVSLRAPREGLLRHRRALALLREPAQEGRAAGAGLPHLDVAEVHLAVTQRRADARLDVGEAGEASLRRRLRVLVGDDLGAQELDEEGVAAGEGEDAVARVRFAAEGEAVWVRASEGRAPSSLTWPL